MHDLVIRGGHVVDGTGARGRLADIAIDEQTITGVGKVGRGRREIDASGLLVTPGFVDVHTHYDAQVTWDPSLTPSSWHGCTTVVMGNCGVGFAPVAHDRHDWLIGLMEGVEDIPGAALSEGIQWAWESFDEYMDALSGYQRSIDFGAQIPHGAVRGYVMGERGANNENATADDLAQMADIVRRGVGAGALGFSTSRTMLHKAIDGRLVPGTFAPREELFALASALKQGGGGVFQVACEHSDVPDEMDWMASLSREFGLPVMFNLSQIDQAPELWRAGFEALVKANQTGAHLRAQVAGRAIGILMSWRGTAHPFALKPTWMALAQRPWAEQWAALQTEDVRHKLLTETPVHVGDFEAFVTQSFNKMYMVDAGYEPMPTEHLAALATETDHSAAALAYEQLMRFDGTGMLYFPLFNYSHNDLSTLETLHRSPDTMMGLSDAGAHCGAICDGGMPTFMLTHWTRDRTRGDTLPLEWIVHRQTQDTARSYGLMDRGCIKPGYKADINLIDYDNLTLERPKLMWDLPAGGRRLLQRAKGYRATICSGVVIQEYDEATGALPGRLIRGRQTTP